MPYSARRSGLLRQVAAVFAGALLFLLMPFYVRSMALLVGRASFGDPGQLVFRIAFAFGRGKLVLDFLASGILGLLNCCGINPLWNANA